MLGNKTVLMKSDPATSHLWSIQKITSVDFVLALVSQPIGQSGSKC